MKPLDLLKRLGEIVGAMALIYGAVVGVILAFDGHVPPWFSVADAQTLEQSLKKFEADQAVHDKATQANIDLLVLGRLRDEARDANQKAAMHPRDASAKADAWFAQKKLDIFFQSHPTLAEAMAK